MKVGDFVRFASRVVLANPHLALTDERGMVVSMSENGRVASVVWPDGQKSDVRVKNLARTIGDAAHVTRNVNEKRCPLRDKGNRGTRPKPPVNRPNPLPTAEGRWKVVDERVVKGRKLDPPIMGKKGELISFMRFPVPLRVSELRGAHWPADTGNIKVSRSANSVTVTFPNGEKSSHTPTAARAWMTGRFGESFAKGMCEFLNI